jgi:hypothetical protein
MAPTASRKLFSSIRKCPAFSIPGFSILYILWD